MGKRGPAKTPTGMKVLNGGKIDNIFEPQPKKARANSRSPIKLSRDENKIFKEVTKILSECNVLTDADLRLAAQFARTCRELQELQEFIQEQGLTCSRVSDKGFDYEAERPQVKRLAQVEAQYLRFSKELGLTPASRGGMKITPGKGKQEEFKKRLYGNR